jgi:hypothetical protein
MKKLKTKVVKSTQAHRSTGGNTLWKVQLIEASRYPTTDVVWDDVHVIANTIEDAIRKATRRAGYKAKSAVPIARIDKK